MRWLTSVLLLLSACGGSVPCENRVPGPVFAVGDLIAKVGNRPAGIVTDPWNPDVRDALWEDVFFADDITDTYEDGYLYIEVDEGASGDQQFYLSNWFNGASAKEDFSLIGGELFFTFIPSRSPVDGDVTQMWFSLTDWWTAGTPYLYVELTTASGSSAVSPAYGSVPNGEISAFIELNDGSTTTSTRVRADKIRWWRVAHNEGTGTIIVQASEGCEDFDTKLSQDWSGVDVGRLNLDFLTQQEELSLPLPEADTILARVQTGLRKRHEYDNGSFPFSTGDWSVGAGSVAVTGGELIWTPPSSNAAFIRHTGVSTSAFRRHFVQTVSAIDSTISSQWMGPAVHMSSDNQDGVAFQMSVDRTFGDGLEHSQIRETEGLAATSASTQSDPPRKSVGSYYRASIWAEDDSAAGYDFDDALLHTHTLTNLDHGGVGVWHINGTPVNIRYFWAMSDRYVYVHGLADGVTAEIQQSDGTLIDSAVASGGYAKLDLLDAEFNGTKKPAKVVAGGKTLAPSDGVWGGDVYRLFEWTGYEHIAIWGPWNPEPREIVGDLITGVGTLPKVPGSVFVVGDLILQVGDP